MSCWNINLDDNLDNYVMQYARGNDLVEPSDVVMCDNFMEEHLNVKAFHKKQLGQFTANLKKKLKKQLVLRSTLKVDRMAGHKKKSVAPTRNQTLRTEVVSPSNTRDVATQTSESALAPKRTYRMRPEFCQVMKTVNSQCAEDKEVDLAEAVACFSKYIISNKVRLFDHRNILVAIIKDDPLYKIFKVKAFHRDQAKAYVKEQLIEVSV